MTQLEQFLEAIQNERKDEAVMISKNVLEAHKISLVEFYDTYILRALNEFDCSIDEHIRIWKEHVRTSIVRTILEMSYPYLIEAKKEIKNQNQKILVLCPKEEYHEIGAILATHYFILAGYDALYLGANTPRLDILSAVGVLNPDFLALSVTNYYNLVETQALTQSLKTNFPNLKIILGGQAFHKHGALETMVYDYYLDSKDSILAFSEVKK